MQLCAVGGTVEITPPLDSQGQGSSVKPGYQVYARLDRVKALWREIAQTPKTSARYSELAREIRVEALAYRAGLDAGMEPRADTVPGAFPGPAKAVLRYGGFRERRSANDVAD